MEPDDIAALASATEKLKQDPKLINHPELGFLRDYLSSAWGVSLNGRGVPVQRPPQTLQIDLSDDEEVKKAGAGGDPPVVPVVEAVDVADSDEEDPDRIPEDSGPYPPLPPKRSSAQEEEAAEAQTAACSAAKQAGQDALDRGNAALALEKFTEALMTGVASALIFVRRAEVLMRMRRPVAAVRDCDAALEVNADCGKAYRVRGLAYRSIGRWEAAHRDLAQGQRLDYDDDAAAVAHLAAEKARRVEERRLALARKASSRKRRRAAK